MSAEQEAGTQGSREEQVTASAHADLLGAFESLTKEFHHLLLERSKEWEAELEEIKQSKEDPWQKMRRKDRFLKAQIPRLHQEVIAFQAKPLPLFGQRSIDLFVELQTILGKVDGILSFIVEKLQEIQDQIRPPGVPPPGAPEPKRGKPQL